MLELNRLYNMDCMEGMELLPDKYFDLAIVDPPYGIGNYWKKSVNTKHYGDATWNNNKPGIEYFDELFRVSKNQIIWGGNYFSDLLAVTNSWIIWDKLMNNNPTSDCELAWTSLKIKMTKITVQWSGALKDEKDFIRIHPCQRPVLLHKKTLSLFAKQGQKILDTHCGSCSSLVACVDMGYEYMGFETNEKYYQAAFSRMEKHKSQLKLFS